MSEFTERLSFEKGHDPAGFHAFGEGIWVPASQLFGLAVTNIAYTDGALAAGGVETTSSPAGTEVLRAVDSVAGATAIVLATLPHPGRAYTVGSSVRGAVVADVTVFYSVIAQVLSGQPTATAYMLAFPAVGATAALPVATALTVAKSPTSFNLAVNTAGQYQTHQYVLSGFTAALADLAKVGIRMSWPMTTGGTLDIAGLLVHYAIQ